MQCHCHRHKPEIHWLDKLRQDLKFQEILRNNRSIKARLKRFGIRIYYKLFPSKNPINLISIIPMSPPSGEIFYVDYTYANSKE